MPRYIPNSSPSSSSTLRSSSACSKAALAPTLALVGKAQTGPVVATDCVSANANCDNENGALYGTPRPRGCDGYATRRVDADRPTNFGELSF